MRPIPPLPTLCRQPDGGIAPAAPGQDPDRFAGILRDYPQARCTSQTSAKAATPADPHGMTARR